VKGQEDVIKWSGAGLLKRYNNTLTKALTSVYPNEEWHIFLFKQVPPGYWTKTQNIREYFDWLAEKLNLQQLDDWYRISFIELSNHGAGTLLSTFGGLHKVLCRCYPEYPWDEKKFFLSTEKKTQTHLMQHLQQLFHSPIIHKKELESVEMEIQ
jgi:hypothetical protein